MLPTFLQVAYLFGCCIFSVIWGFMNVLFIRAIDMEDSRYLIGEKGSGAGSINEDTAESHALMEKMKGIQKLIYDGAVTFLKQEYLFLTVFLLLMGIILPFTAEPDLSELGNGHSSLTFYTTTAFLVGGFTSVVSGYIGMLVAVYTNARTTKESAESIGKGFVCAYRGGEVLGFVLVGFALVVLVIIILLFTMIF
jgi:inorganic pyrophosphatase